MAEMKEAVQQRVNAWLNGAFDEDVKQEIRTLQQQNEAELNDAFYRTLEFGTGGLRGIMGAGTNRMNRYTVGMATQGYANYLKKSFPGAEIRVAVA
ncbi:MAG TPA: phospho-sugar mutase, partial [Flavisolibacter sp.]